MTSSPLTDAVFLPQSNYRRMRWKNGLGWTSEVMLENGADGIFDWRISIAEIDQNSDFSLFPGIDRTLVVLSGGGMALDIAGQGTRELHPLQNPFVFPGEDIIRARLFSGPTRDFNVMTRRTAYTHELSIHSAGNPLQMKRNDKTSFFLYGVSGSLWGAEAGDGWYVPRGSEATIEVPADVALLVVELQKIAA